MEQPSRNPRDKERVDVGRGPEYLAHEIGDLLKLEKAALRRRWAIVFDAYASRHLRHYLAMGREGTDRRLFVLSHEAAVAEHVGAEYGGEFAFHAILKNQNDLAVSKPTAVNRASGDARYTHRNNLRKNKDNTSASGHARF
jgi:hypothetical protein